MPKWYLLNVCRPPPANDAPRASPYPAAETMARLRRAALKDLLCTAIPGLGSRVFVIVPVAPGTITGLFFFWSENLEGRI